MNTENIIRATQSVCPLCLESVPATVLERDGRVYLTKICPRHGISEILLSETASLYKELESFFFGVMNPSFHIREYEIWVTMRCNTSCTICHLGDSNRIGIPDPSLEKIEEFITRHDQPAYILSGGEPTCREDLPAIIHLFKKHGKHISLHTNGLALGDKKYVQSLQDAGLNRINLQFDGFDPEAYEIFRGKNILDKKQRALRNLEELHLPTDLNMTIARGVNEQAVMDSVEFAGKHPFISSVNFFTICYLGETARWPLRYFLMPDTIGDILEKGSGGRISKRSIILFQKLHLAIKSLRSERYCLYSQIFVLFRKRNGTYAPIDRYLNLERADRLLGFYQRMAPRHPVFAKIVLVLGLPFFLIRWSTLVILKEILRTGFSFLINEDYALKSNPFLYLNFNTSCDPYKIDYGFVNHCQDEIIFYDQSQKCLVNQGVDGLRAIDFERRYRKAAPKETIRVDRENGSVKKE
ncbi:MAG: radical SAM protein [Candidatus Omnitrophota bacterium]|jgi:sulfatase maturation enzyme AslB (radical SAM superfamily)